MSLLDPFKLDGVKYDTAQGVRAAKKKKALMGVVSNKGVRNKLWNLFASKQQKQSAKDELASIM